VHYRSDHPYADHDNWLKEIVIRQENGKPQMKTRSVVATVMTPPKGRFPYMEALLKAMEAHSKVGGGH
jgi:hypothetical protein